MTFISLVQLVKVLLNVEYTSGYPDEVPHISLELEEGELEEEEIVDLINGMKTVVCLEVVVIIGLVLTHRNKGEENLGMAMVFTLVTHLREALVEVIEKRIAREKEIEQEKERQIMEVIQTPYVFCCLN